MSAAPQPAVPFAAASSAHLTGWRIAFVSKDAIPAGASLAIDDSAELFARCERADAAQLLAGAAPACDLQLLAVSLAAPPDVHAESEAWARAGGEIVEARMKTARALAAQDRALVVAASEQLADSIDAVVRYCAIARGVNTLEKNVARALAGLDAKAARDAPAPSSADAANAKRSLLRWQRAIEQFQPGLPQQSQRLFGELDEAGRLEERIEMLEDPIQAIYDFCALGSERKHYYVGIVTEVAILAVLGLELAVMIYQAVYLPKG